MEAIKVYFLLPQAEKAWTVFSFPPVIPGRPTQPFSGLNRLDHAILIPGHPLQRYVDQMYHFRDGDSQRPRLLSLKFWC